MSSTTTLLQANIGVGLLSTANSNLNGSGTTATCFTAGTVSGGSVGIFSGGCVVTGITVKASAVNGTTAQGMVRLFLLRSSNYFILKEIEIPPTTQSGVLPTFSCTLPMRLPLDAGDSIVASTQNGDTFNVFVYGFNYGSMSYNTNMNVNSIMNGANTGLAQIMIGTSSITGTGSTILLSAIGTTGNTGTTIKTITIKSQVSNAQGMIRFFIYNGTTYYLWQEVMVPATTQSSTIPTFGTTIPVNLVLPTGYSLYTSTQNNETFDIIANGNNFSCVPLT